MASSSKSKKGKSKIGKLVKTTDSNEDEDIHELSYYANDRVKLMKEVLKIIKPKKIKSMAPDCLRDVDVEEINSMLLEELLGISNKRLKYIFEGKNLDEDTSSSTDPENENPAADIISLSDISDNDFIIDVDSDKPQRHKSDFKEKGNPYKKIKREKRDKLSKDHKGKSQEENLMSVLELLELQARARAIRSQLLLETNKKTDEISAQVSETDIDDPDAIIIESPKNQEIVITSTDSDTDEESTNKCNSEKKSSNIESEASNKTASTKKIKLIRDRYNRTDSNIMQDNHAIALSDIENTAVTTADQENASLTNVVETIISESDEQARSNNDNLSKDIVEKNSFEDTIVINVDQADMDEIIEN